MGDYKEIARDARLTVLDMIHRAGTSHIGSNFSAIDIMAVLFDKIDLDKDRFVLSAGWKAASLYYFLWKKGRITWDELHSYCIGDSKFIGLAEPVIPEIKIAGGSMGLGLPGAVGLALAKKLKGEGGMVYVLMSDGELQIGTTWESALIAAQHKLSNLTIIVDLNGFQAMGKTEDILDCGFPGVGVRELVIDGHNYDIISGAIEGWRAISDQSDIPTVIIAKTIKGKGVSFMENDNSWHYRHVNKKEYELAREEIRQS